MTTTVQSDLRRHYLLQDWMGRRSFEKFRFAVKQLVTLTDLTKESANAVKYALSVAQHFRARLTLLYISTPFRASDSCVTIINAERNLLRLEAATRAKYKQCDACLRCGPYAEVAFKVAEERSADLLVVPESNLSWFRYFIHDDYDGSFVLNAPCPVMVVADELG